MGSPDMLDMFNNLKVEYIKSMDDFLLEVYGPRVKLYNEEWELASAIALACLWIMVTANASWEESKDYIRTLFKDPDTMKRFEEASKSMLYRPDYLEYLTAHYRKAAELGLVKV